MEKKEDSPRDPGRSIEEEMVKVSERRARDRKRGREEKREQHRTRGPDIRGQKGQIPQQSTNRERPPFMEPRNCRAMTGSP